MELTKKLLRAALHYASLGYRVFPCVPSEKNPLTEHGFHDATADTEQIERWWSLHPNANVAIATEKLLVLDEDGANNPWLTGDSQRQMDLSEAPLALTPHDGNHRYFRQPRGKGWRCTESKLAPKVDTRADGGYVLVPPSIVEGKAYRWAPELKLDDPPDRLDEPPSWLVAELDRLAHGSPTFPSTPPEVGLGDPEANVIPKGQRNATLARLAGGMRRNGMTQAEIEPAIQRVNRDRCKPPIAAHEVNRIAASVARYRPDEVAVAMAENHWDQMYVERLPEDCADAEEAEHGGVPDELLHIPGFIDEMMTYTLRTAPYPERTLAFCGALSLQAMLAGRKVRDAADNRTNLYVLGLANSGAGKDYPRKVNQKVLLEAGLPECLGDGFASGEGIEDRMLIQPSMLFQTDEIDGLMSKINLGKDARHEGIMNVLLKMYTSANSFYAMRVKAGREISVIDQPSLCIFGTAIPKHYYEALSLKMLTNGFFARMLVLETGRRCRGQESIVDQLPVSICETARWWVEFSPGQKRGNLSSFHPVPKVIDHSDEARHLFQSFRQRADDQYALAEEKGDPVGMAVWARAHEKARRLALVHACSANHREPVVQADGVRWACAFVEHQTRHMLFMTGEYVSENEFEARCKKLVNTLRQWREQHGDAWMPYWQINRRHTWSPRDHEEVRTSLLDQRLIEYQERKTGGTPQRVYRLA